MEADNILEQYGLTREITTKYIEAITRFNQTETAEQLDVSPDTIHRYKTPSKTWNPVNASYSSPH